MKTVTYSLLMLLLWLLPSLSIAHPLSPQSVWAELLPTTDGNMNNFTIRYKYPVRAPRTIRIDWPNQCHALLESEQTDADRTEQTYQLQCPQKIAPILRFFSPETSDEQLGDTTIIATITQAQKTHHQVLNGHNQTLNLLVKSNQYESNSFTDFIIVGGEHLLFGWDHLAFVFGLFLLLKNRRRELISAVTAFTLGHSLTLFLASLHIVTLPSAPVEIAIALSIVLLAFEVVNKDGVLVRKPWLICAFIGLIHGLGFAGAMSEIAIDSSQLVIGLIAFNLGLELAQLFVLIVLFVIWKPLNALPWQSRIVQLASYAIGIMGAYWTIDRLYTALITG